jgi:predicted dehydrogenase
VKRIKTAIVGTGFMGKVHAEQVRRLGNVDIEAVVGSSRERAKSFAEAAGIPIATGDLQEVLDHSYLHAQCGPFSAIDGRAKGGKGRALRETDDNDGG